MNRIREKFSSSLRKELSLRVLRLILPVITQKKQCASKVLRLHVPPEGASSETTVSKHYSVFLAFIKGEARNNFPGESVSVWKVCFAF